MNRPAKKREGCDNCGRNLSERAAKLTTGAGCVFCRSDGGSE